MNNQKYILRICDLVLSFFAIIFLSPFLIIILFCCFLDSKEPIFIQKRVGQNLRPFYLYKFRTMKKNTPSLATHLITKKNVTKLGRIIRILKLDELPQLINVMKGEMSLVGPRPCLINQIALINERKKYNNFKIKTGINCIAQIRGVDMSDPKILAEFDFQMISNLNINNYFKYLFLTLLGQGLSDRISK